VRVLGTGGAARATCFALAEAGWSVQVCGRRPEPAAALAAVVGGEAIGWSQRAEAPFDVLVNATPLGAQPGESPMPEATPWAGRTALDMLLAPRPTTLLQQVTAGGGRAVTGQQMWVHQGAAQWTLLTGRRVSAAQLEARLRALGDPASAPRDPASAPRDAASAPPPPLGGEEGA
jgi:shikimate dehydrogenase